MGRGEADGVAEDEVGGAAVAVERGWGDGDQVAAEGLARDEEGGDGGEGKEGGGGGVVGGGVGVVGHDGAFGDLVDHFGTCRAWSQYVD